MKKSPSRLDLGDGCSSRELVANHVAYVAEKLRIGAE
jgi:hypothetical protein